MKITGNQWVKFNSALQGAKNNARMDTLRKGRFFCRAFKF